MKKRLSAFIGSINIKSIRGPSDPVITGLQYDSRRVLPGNLFFALPGLHTDGCRYIGAAAEKGAAAVLHTGKLDEYREEITYIETDNPRKAMSAMSADFHGRPAEQLYTIGVTGTDGKSSTVFFIHQLLRACGTASGYLSTVSFDTGKRGESNFLRQSTPEATEIHSLLAEMRENKLTHAVVEATSHGLSEKTMRLADVAFTAAVFTNISHEHLEFHGSFEQYRADKCRLFSSLKRREGAPPQAVINGDDRESSSFIDAAEASGADVLLYSMDPAGNADCCIEAYREQKDRIEFTLNYKTGEDTASYTSVLPMTGLVNLENLMAAFLTTVRCGGFQPETVIAAVPELQSVEGRMKLIDAGQPFRVIVDYAHTPGSFEAVFPFFTAGTDGRLIGVFGSAGERDLEKRSIQGKIADKYCDILILADEDPRGEEPEAILRDIAEGTTGRREGSDLFLIADRREAIMKAFSLAGPGDTVVLLGKGHEKSIIYRNGPVPWNESRVAEECLAEAGWKKSDDGAPA